tara:strand:+ start:5879 stop:6889 length:1011 start_codon:yes stop_codon:yes gene_type:complete
MPQKILSQKLPVHLIKHIYEVSMMKKYILFILFLTQVTNLFSIWPPEEGLTERDTQKVQSILNKFYEGDAGFLLEHDLTDLKKYAEMGHPELSHFYGEHLLHHSQSKAGLEEATRYIFFAAEQGNADSLSLIESIIGKKYDPNALDLFKQNWPDYYSETQKALLMRETIPVERIAAYLLTKTQEKEEDEAQMTNLSLQKTLYFAQTCRMQLAGKPLFEAPIACWTYGPVVMDVYHNYKHFNKSPIKLPESDYEKLDGEQHEEIRKFLDVVWEVTQKYSPLTLKDITHQDKCPWRWLYEERQDKEINLYWLRMDSTPIIQEIKERLEPKAPEAKRVK